MLQGVLCECLLIGEFVVTALASYLVIVLLVLVLGKAGQCYSYEDTGIIRACLSLLLPLI